MNARIVQVVSVLMLATILISATSQPGFASALVSTKSSGQATMQSAGPTDPQELKSFLGDLMAAKMAENQIPGAMVTVVEDGRVLLARGYGYADVADQVPVDPERTLFRVGFGF